jgi:hypothetical protein
VVEKERVADATAQDAMEAVVEVERAMEAMENDAAV